MRCNGEGFRARFLGSVLVLSVVTACGFQMRGSYDLPAELTPIAVTGGGNVANAVANGLRRNGAEVAARADGAASRLEIMNESTDQEVLSVDADGDVDEFGVHYSVRWQLLDPSAEEEGRPRVLIAPETVRARRSYDFASDEVLSSQEQRRAIEETLRDDLALRILSRVQAWSPAAAPGDGAD